MSDPLNPQLLGARAPAAVRAAEAMLRTVGGSSVSVRVPVTTSDATTQAQIGVSGVSCEDVALAPVIVRRFKGPLDGKLHRELIMAAGTLARLREIHATDDAEKFFRTAVGVVVESRLMRVTGFAADEFSGTPYIYRVQVTE